MERSFEVVRSRSYGSKQDVSRENANGSLVGYDIGGQESSGMAVHGAREMGDCSVKAKERRRSRFREEFGDDV